MKIKKVRKQEMVTKFYDKPKSQNPTYCFCFLSELIVSALLIILQSLLALYQLCLLLQYRFGLPHILLKILSKYTHISHISILPFLFYGPVQ